MNLGFEILAVKKGYIPEVEKPSINLSIAKDLINKKVTIFEKIVAVKTKCNDSVNLQWKISNDTIHYNNLVLKKATTQFRGRNYIAWYCEELPYTDGPYKFSGLPGLIVKIHDDRDFISFDMINLKTFDKTQVFDEGYDKYKETTYEEFHKAKEELRLNPIPVLEMSGVTLQEEHKRMVRKNTANKIKVWNNHIELTTE